MDRRPSIFSFIVVFALYAPLVALVDWLLFPLPTMPLNISLPGIALTAIVPASLRLIWIGPLCGLVGGYLIAWALYLLKPRYVCPICGSSEEKLSELDHWRGHRAHAWHPAG